MLNWIKKLCCTAAWMSEFRDVTIFSFQRSHIKAHIAGARQALQERLEDGCFDDAWRHARDSIFGNDAQLASLESRKLCAVIWFFLYEDAGYM